MWLNAGPRRGRTKDPIGAVLTATVRGRGVASVSVIDRAGADPLAFWVPESADEPAFLAYSITKTVTASLVLKLCEEGQLSLDDPLAKWSSSIAKAGRITLRQLLNHAAGIPDYGGISAYHEGVSSSPSIPWSFERFVVAGILDHFMNAAIHAPPAKRLQSDGTSSRS